MFNPLWQLHYLFACIYPYFFKSSKMWQLTLRHTRHYSEKDISNIVRDFRTPRPCFGRATSDASQIFNSLRLLSFCSVSTGIHFIFCPMDTTSVARVSTLDNEARFKLSHDDNCNFFRDERLNEE